MSEHGKMAYEAYCKIRDWKSVRGEPLPQYWELLPPDLQTAWDAAGKAVVDSVHLDELNSSVKMVGVQAQLQASVYKKLMDLAAIAKLIPCKVREMQNQGRTSQSIDNEINLAIDKFLKS